MTEDEAFIRTIVDSPGDDLPRLVYADWLDERDDPRGAYLRAELEWAKTKQTTGFLLLRLHGLAKGLDPVWVARASRPPVGVCCDLIDIKSYHPLPTVSDVQDRETDLRFRLPLDYHAFLLNYNGGETPAAWTPTPGNEAGVSLYEFYRLDKLGGTRWWEGERPVLRDRPMLAIAHNGMDDWPVMIDVRPQSTGAVYLLDTETDYQFIRLAKSLPVFLNGLEPRTDEDS